MDTTTAVAPLAPTGPRYCANPNCGKRLPYNALITRRTCDAACRSQISPAHRNRLPMRKAARAAAAAARRAAAGHRVCAAPGCSNDISHRDERTVTCSTAHRVLLHRSHQRQAELEDTTMGD